MISLELSELEMVFCEVWEMLFNDISLLLSCWNNKERAEESKYREEQERRRRAPGKQGAWKRVLVLGGSCISSH